MRTQVVVSASRNMALIFKLVTLNAELVVPTSVMSVRGPERQFASSVLTARREGLAVIFLCLVYMS